MGSEMYNIPVIQNLTSWGCRQDGLFKSCKRPEITQSVPVSKWNQMSAFLWWYLWTPQDDPHSRQHPSYPLHSTPNETFLTFFIEFYNMTHSECSLDVWGSSAVSAKVGHKAIDLKLKWSKKKTFLFFF